MSSLEVVVVELEKVSSFAGSKTYKYRLQDYFHRHETNTLLKFSIGFTSDFMDVYMYSI